MAPADRSSPWNTPPSHGRVPPTRIACLSTEIIDWDLAMTEAEPLLRNISDTARWAAVYRARETERPDALFRDPFARKLAGERGEEIANSIEFSNQNTWSWIARTYLFDHFISQEIANGCDLVVNLAAGLD